MDNIVVADKQTEVATQSAWGNINLKGPGVVQMPVAPDQLATVTQRGQDLVLTLKSGKKSPSAISSQWTRPVSAATLSSLARTAPCGTPSTMLRHSRASPSKT